MESIKGKHPHGRGEDQQYSRCVGNQLETPPRAWGRHFDNAGRGGKSRNTPTGVGKTTAQVPVPGLAEKHPHGRGEDTPLFIP